MAQKYTDGRKRYLCCVLQKQRAVRMAPSNGCALCENKESSRWNKNTDTGERDICESCYQKQRAIGNGTTERVCSVREEGKCTLVQKYRDGRKRYL